MSGIRKNIWKYLKDRVFRQSYVEEHVRAGVAHQIKAMREARGWSQAQLAVKCGKSQSNIARIEDPDYGKFSIQTLLEIAHTFDVWLSLEFVSFGKGLARTADRSAQALNALSFDEELSLSVKYSVANRAVSSSSSSALQSYQSAPRRDSLNQLGGRELAATPLSNKSISDLNTNRLERAA
jgi:transcriptional regulator with XRE-family HTH domain